jgi:hypothetical protein
VFALDLTIQHAFIKGRICPDLDAELFFNPDEIDTVYLLHDKTPPERPRLNDVLRQIARIGDFLARKSEGEPGVKTIWLGLKECTCRGKNYAVATPTWSARDLCITGHEANWRRPQA